MNLHIEGQKLRFRISKDALASLCEGQGLTHRVFLPNQHALYIDICPSTTHHAALHLVAHTDHMILHVQPDAAERLYQALPSKDGLQIDQPIESQQALKLVLEVDIRTQKRSHTSAEKG
jgi:hypothetical protein